MKEKIFSKLKETIGKTSLSERTLQKKAEILAKSITSEDLLTEELMADVIDELKTLEGQLNHDVAEALKKQKTSKDDSKKESPAEPNLNPDDDDFKAKILAEIQELKAERQKEQEAAKKDELRKNIIGTLKKNGATNELILKAALYESGVDFTKSVEDNVKLVREAYDKEASAMPDEPMPFFGGGGGEQKNEAEREAERLARKEKIRKEGRL